MYGLIAAAAIVVTELDENTNGIEDDLGYLAMFLGWGAGIAHSFVVRKAYLRRIGHPRGPSAAGRAPRRASARPTPASSRCATRSSPARRSSAAAGGFDEGGVVDVNHAPVEDIADLPRIDAETARQIVAARDGVGGFSSLEDLGLTMDLPGDVVESLRGRVVFLPR